MVPTLSVMLPCTDVTHLQVSRVRPPATQAALKAAATAVELITDCCVCARPCMATKQRLHTAQGVGPQEPSCSQESSPVASLHTQRRVWVTEVHMRSVLLQSAVTLHVPAASGALAVTTNPPGTILPVLVPCAVHRLRLPLGTYGTAGELPGTVVRLPRLQVGSKPAMAEAAAVQKTAYYRQHNWLGECARA